MKKLLPFLLSVSLIFSSCAQKKDFVVTFKTPYGDMVAILYDETPKHKENFIKLAKEHYFDSLLFHRVIQEFMIQGGDPDSKNATPGQHLGSGGPTYTIPAEFNPKFVHEKGALSAARTPDAQNPTKASSGSQFYIVQGKTWTKDELTFDQGKFNLAMQKYFENPANKGAYDSLFTVYRSGDIDAYNAFLHKLKPRVEKETGMETEKNVNPEVIDLYSTVGGSPHLDGQYTVFGKVIKGLEVIDKIASQPVDEAHRPVEDIRMMVTVEEMSKKKIEKEYGYKYPEEKK